MAITFKFRGATFKADTPQEAAETLALLKKSEAEQKERQNAIKAFRDERMSRFQEPYKDSFTRLTAYDESRFEWTRDRFEALINRLGGDQKLVLALLVTRQNITDEELRNVLQVPNNQALAGVLSGISKQAIALFVPPRKIFDFENIRSGGKRRSDYLVADEFRKIAGEMDWPPPSILSRLSRDNA